MVMRSGLGERWLRAIARPKQPKKRGSCSEVEISVLFSVKQAVLPFIDRVIASPRRG